MPTAESAAWIGPAPRGSTRETAMAAFAKEPLSEEDIMAKATLEEIFKEHFHYEIDMLLATFIRLLVPVPDTAVSNALIESFCIHARNLDDFFRGRRGAKAETYATASYRAYIGGGISNDLDKKVNTQIAHLTEARTSDPAEKIGPQDRLDLVKTLLAEVHNFAQHLQATYQPLSRLAAYPSQPSAGPVGPSGTPPSLSVGPTGPTSTSVFTVMSSTPVFKNS
jgi:hypothetical protein